MVARIERGQIVDPKGRKFRADAKELLRKAAEIYPSIGSYEPDANGPPSMEPILMEIEERIEKLQAAGIDVYVDDDEPPF